MWIGATEPNQNRNKCKQPNISAREGRWTEQRSLRHVYALYDNGDERKKNLWRWMLWFDDHTT